MQNGQLTWKFITNMAPFISDTALNNLVLQGIDDMFNEEHIIGLAPFLEEDTIEHLVSIASSKGEWSFIQKMAPFIGEASFNELVDKAVNGEIELEQLIELAPFLEEDAIDQLLSNMDADKLSPQLLAKLAPFIEENSLGRIVKQLLKTK